MIKSTTTTNQEAVYPVRNNDWISLGEVERYLTSLGKLSVVDLPGRITADGTQDLDEQVQLAIRDFERDGKELKSLSQDPSKVHVDNSKIDRLGSFIMDSSSTASLRGLDQYVGAVLKHSQVKILPTKNNPDILRPALIIDRSYTEDNSMRNVDLLKLAQFLAQEFDFTDIYLPDLSIVHSDNGDELTAFGGYRAASFLDVNPKSKNQKEILRFYLTVYKQHSKTGRRLLDYGRAQLFHSKKDTFMVVDFPKYEDLDDMGIPFRSEKEYQKWKTDMLELFSSPHGEKSSIMLLDDFDSTKHTIIANKLSSSQETNPAKKALLDALDSNTPEHIVDTLHKQKWFYDVENNQLIMMPRFDEPSQNPYSYVENDKLRLAEFFTSQSNLSVRAFEHSDLANPAINKLHFARDT